MNNSGRFELRWMLDVLRRRMWFVLGFSLTVAILACGLTILQPRAYHATVTLLIDPAHNGPANEYSAILAGEQLAVTYSQMITALPVMQEVISQLNLNETPDSLARKIQVTTVPNTQLIRLTVSGSSPPDVVRLADTISTTFVAYINRLNTERYNTTLAAMKMQLDSLSAQIQTDQKNIDQLNAEKIQGDAEITRLESLLSQYRNEYENLKQNNHSIQLALSQVKGTVSTLADAQLVNSRLIAPTASITFWVNQAATNGPAGNSTYVQMLTGKSVLDATIEKLGLTTSTAEFQKKLAVSPAAGGQLITLSVTDRDPSQAILIANSLAQIYMSQVNALLNEPYTSQLASIQKQLDDQQALIDQTQTQIGSTTSRQAQIQTQLTNLSTSIVEKRNDDQASQQNFEQLQLAAMNSMNSITIADPAQAPEVQFIGILIRSGGLAGLAAAILAAGIAFSLEYFNDRIKTVRDVQQALGLNPLGMIGHLKNGESGLPPEKAGPSGIGEAFRILGANIQFTGNRTALRTLLVTSPASAEGKSSIAAHLAATFAEKGLQVIAVDTDLRIPRLHQLFGVDRGEGLVDALLCGNEQIHLQPSGIEGLTLLTSGKQVLEPWTIVSSPGMGQLLERLCQLGEMIVLDGPPVLPVADTSILASLVDGVILVVRAGVTSRQSALDAIESLHKAGANLIGVVLNDSTEHERRAYYYAGEISLKNYRRPARPLIPNFLAQAIKKIRQPAKPPFPGK